METTRTSRVLRMARNFAGRKTDEVEEGAEGGFTLIELMVVLLIMAILLAIAIPTFLGVKGSAQNRAAQSDLTNAITSAKAVYTNAGNYGGSSSLAAGMNKAEPELSFGVAAVSYSTATPHAISVETSTDGLIVVMAEQAANQTCWYIMDNEEPSAANDGLSNATTQQGITYGSSAGVTGTSCSAQSTPAGGVTGWGTSYPPS